MNRRKKKAIAIPGSLQTVMRIVSSNKLLLSELATADNARHGVALVGTDPIITNKRDLPTAGFFVISIIQMYHYHCLFNFHVTSTDSFKTCFFFVVAVC